MLPHTIDDKITESLTCSVEVTIDFGSQKRWLFSATPQLLASVGNRVGDTQVRVHLGERHMIVVNELSATIIDTVLRQLHDVGELESRTLALELPPKGLTVLRRTATDLCGWFHGRA